MAFALVGAAGIAAATFVPYNAIPGDAHASLLEVYGISGAAATPLGIAAALVAVALLAPVLPRPFVAGAILGLGVAATAAWTRYAAIPRIQEANTPQFADPQYGAIIGLVAALLVVIAAVRLARRPDATVAASPPRIPTAA
jgi:hypothetical protein